MNTWVPPTNETTPTVVYNQDHLRIKHTHSWIMTAWQMHKWRGWTTDLGEVVQGWTEPVEQPGGVFVALVTLLDRRTSTRTVAWLKVQAYSPL